MGLTPELVTSMNADSNSVYVAMQYKIVNHTIHIQGRGPTVNREYGVSADMYIPLLNEKLGAFLLNNTKTLVSMSGSGEKTYSPLYAKLVGVDIEINEEIYQALVNSFNVDTNFADIEDKGNLTENIVYAIGYSKKASAEYGWNMSIDTNWVLNMPMINVQIPAIGVEVYNRPYGLSFMCPAAGCKEVMDFILLCLSKYYHPENVVKNPYQYQK
jgi:hypothetical protein